jgi:hypothetical protein
VSQNDELRPLSPEELAAETGAALPDKEVISLLDLNADLDLALDAAAPIDLAVAANANDAAPIDAAGGAATAVADQGALIDQGITREATAHAVQDSGFDQSGEPTTDGTTSDATSEPTGTDVGAVPTETGGVLDGDLLDVDVNIDADLNLAAPIDGAVAANANVAAPIDASVAANVASIDSSATSIAQQDAIITQDIDADANATADQTSTITQ